MDDDPLTSVTVVPGALEVDNVVVVLSWTQANIFTLTFFKLSLLVLTKTILIRLTGVSSNLFTNGFLPFFTSLLTTVLPFLVTTTNLFTFPEITLTCPTSATLEPTNLKTTTTLLESAFKPVFLNAFNTRLNDFGSLLTTLTMLVLKTTDFFSQICGVVVDPTVDVPAGPDVDETAGPEVDETAGPEVDDDPYDDDPWVDENPVDDGPDEDDDPEEDDR